MFLITFYLCRNEVEENEEKIKNHETLITSLRGENKVMKSQLKKLSDDKLKSAELVAMLEQSERYILFVILKIVVAYKIDLCFSFSIEILKGTAQQAIKQLVSVKN